MTPVQRQGPEALGALEALEWETAEDSEAGVGARAGVGVGVRVTARLEAAELAEANLRTEWIPITKLGQLVKNMKSLEEICLFSLPLRY